MSLIDWFKNLVKDEEIVTQGEFMDAFKRQFPAYADKDNADLAQRLAQKDQRQYGFLTGYEESKPIPPQLVPKDLRSQKFYDANPTEAVKDAQQSLNDFRKSSNAYYDVPDDKLAAALEKKFPNDFKGLTARLTYEPTPSTSYVDLIQKEGKKALQIGQQSLNYIKKKGGALETELLKGILSAPDAATQIPIFPGVNVPSNLGKDVALAGTLELGGFYKGVTGQELPVDEGTLKSIRDRDVNPETAKAAGEMVGGLAMLGGMGTVLRAHKVGSTVTQVFARTPQIARILGAATSAGVSFGGAGAVQDAIKQVSEGKMNFKELGARTLEDTALGLGFGGVTAGTAGLVKNPLSDALLQTAGGSAYGFGTALAQGADLTSAAINAGVTGLYALAGAKDATEAQRIGAIKTARTNVEMAAEFEATKRGFSPDQTQKLREAASGLFDKKVAWVDKNWKPVKDVDPEHWDRQARDVWEEMGKAFDELSPRQEKGRPALPAPGEKPMEGEGAPSNNPTNPTNLPAVDQGKPISSLSESGQLPAIGRANLQQAAQSLGVQPHEMTFDLFKDINAADLPEDQARAIHKDLVLTAAKEGLPIPAEVAKEYPGLSKLAENIVPETSGEVPAIQEPSAEKSGASQELPATPSSSQGLPGLQAKEAGAKYEVLRSIKNFFMPTDTRPDSPAVKEWAGNSVVRKPDGKLKVVFHGTFSPEQFTSFDRSKRELGFHFAENSEIANRRLDPFANDDLEDYGYHPGQYPNDSRVIPAYIRLENPLVVEHDLGDWSSVPDWKYLASHELGLFSEKQVESWKTIDDVRKALQDAGYDGVQYVNQYENSRHMPREQRTSYIVFEPNQIKSIFNEAPTLKHEDILRENEDFKNRFEVIHPTGDYKPSDQSEFNISRTPKQQEQLQLFDDSLKNAGFTKPPAFEVSYRKDGYLVIPNKKVETAADVAYAFRQFHNVLQENFLLVAVKKNRVAAIEHIAFGTMDQVAVYPFETINLLDKYDADSYFLVHNHPSGYVGPSEEDKRLTAIIKDVLNRNGREFRGHIIIDDTKFGFLDPSGLYTAMEHKEYAKTKKIPLLRKHFEWTGNKTELMSGPLLTNPGAVFELAKGIALKQNEAMVLLMNVQNDVMNSAIIPQAAVTSGNLQLLASRFRAPNLLVVQHNLDPRSISRLHSDLRDASLRLLDVVQVTNTSYTSARGTGLLYEKPTEKYEIGDNPAGAKLHSMENGKPLFEITGQHTREGEIVDAATLHKLGIEFPAPTFHEEHTTYEPGGEKPFTLHDKGEEGGPYDAGGDAQEPATGGDVNFDPAQLEGKKDPIEEPNRLPMSSGGEGINLVDLTPPYSRSVERLILNEAKALRQEAIDKLDPLLRFVEENGKLRPYAKDATGKRPMMEEFTNAVPNYLRQYRRGLGRPLDTMAQEAHNAGLLNDASDKEFLDRLSALPRRLPKVSDFADDAVESIRARLAAKRNDWADFARVQPDLRKEIEKLVTPSRIKLPKVYTERAALRRGLQLQAYAAAEAAQATEETLAKIKLNVAEALKAEFPQDASAKFLTRLAKITTPAQAEALITDILKASSDPWFLETQQKAARLAAKEALADLKDLQKGLVQELKDKLPRDVQAKFLKALVNARSPKDIVKLLDRIDAAAVDSQKRTLIGSIKDLLRAVHDSKSISIDYKDKVSDLMDSYLTAKPRIETMRRVLDLQAYIERERAAGRPVGVPEYILGELRLLSAKPLRDMNVAELENVYHSINQIAHLGALHFRVKEETERLRMQNDLADLKAGSVPLTYYELKRKEGSYATDPATFGNLARRAANFINLRRIAITPVDVLMDLLDGLQAYQGPNYRIIKAPLDAHFGQYLNTKDAWINPLHELAKELKLTSKNFQKIGVYAMAVQKDGLQKLENVGITLDEVRGLQLTDAERKFYLKLRGTFDGVYPMLREYMRDVHNVDLGYQENYFTFLTDWDITNEETISDQVLNEWFRKTVAKNSTIARKGPGSQKVVIDAMEIAERYLDQVAFLTNMGRTVKYLQTLIEKPEYREAAGPLGQSLMRDYLGMIARNGGNVGARIRGLDVLRSNMGVARLFWSLSTTGIQIFAVNDAVPFIGTYAYSGLAKMADKEYRDFVYKNMPEVRHRVGDSPDWGEMPMSKILAATKKYGFLPAEKLDQYAAAGVGMGAYMKKLAERGIELDLSNPDKAALAYAERIVRRSQASPYAKDLPLTYTLGLVTGNRSADKAFWQFWNFMLNKYSAFRHEGTRYLGKDPGSALWVMFAIMLAQVAEYWTKKGIKEAQTLVTGFHQEPSEDTWDETVIKQTLDNVPFVSQAQAMYLYGRFPAPAIDSVLRMAQDARAAMKSQGRQSRIRKTLAVAGGVGNVLGVPGTGQITNLARQVLTHPTKPELTPAERAYRQRRKELLEKTAPLRAKVRDMKEELKWRAYEERRKAH